MAISFTKYVDIVSGVGGNAGVRERDLILRVFTTNDLVPPGSFIEFTTLSDVLAYFGSTSEEYKRAVFYFGWISKNITAPQKIAYARWADADEPPRIFGNVQDQALASFTSITAGTFSLKLGATTNTIGPIDFSGAASLAAVATLVQTAIRAKTGSMWTAATVAYDATRGSFNFVGGVAGAAAIATAAGTGGSDCAAQLGWLTGAILAPGADEETVTETLDASAQASDNFASFLFMPSLSVDEIEEAAAWNDAQNEKFMYCIPVTQANAAAYYTALAGYSGAGVTLSEIANEYPEQFPAMIGAATDYDRQNSVVNFMFQQATLTPGVTTTALSNTLDAERTNYYGRTQTAGQFRDFYQRGVLMGGDNDAVDMNTYFNEIWLKDAAGASILSLLLSVGRLPANKTGQIQLEGILQTVVDRALFNGTISVGKALNATQKLFISDQTGDDKAWYQVQNAGYWLGVTFESFVTEDSRTEWKAVYTLIYSKDDAIRKVEGSHQLI
jgi:hypothetical protein